MLVGQLFGYLIQFYDYWLFHLIRVSGFCLTIGYSYSQTTPAKQSGTLILIEKNLIIEKKNVKLTKKLPW